MDVIDAFPYNGPGTSNGASPAGGDRVLHVKCMSVSTSVNFMEMEEEKDDDKSGPSDSWTIKELKDYLRKKGGRLSGRKSELVSR